MPQYKFLITTQSERKGQVKQLHQDDTRTKQLLKKGFIELYDPIEERKVDAPSEIKQAPKRQTKSKDA